MRGVISIFLKSLAVGNNSDPELSVEMGTILSSWNISGNGESAIPNDLMGL